MATFAILNFPEAAIAQLGERQTEDLKVPGSIPGLGTGETARAGARMWKLRRCQLRGGRSTGGRAASLSSSLAQPSVLMVRAAAGVFMKTSAILKIPEAAIAQLGERQTEDLKVPGSIPGLGTRRTARLGARVQKLRRCHLCRHRSPDG